MEIYKFTMTEHIGFTFATSNQYLKTKYVKYDQ